MGTKISAYTALAARPAQGDLLVIVDVSDTSMAGSGTDKKLAFSYIDPVPAATITTGRALAAADHDTLIPGIHATNDIDCTLGILSVLPLRLILGKMGSGTGRIAIVCSGGVTVDGVSNPTITSTVAYGTIVLEAYANDAYYQVA